jgi:Holliday junction resolvase RusA-like endonuclease
MARIAVDFPFPPSINTVWRGTIRRGRLAIHRSDTYKKWQKQFGLEWMAQKPRGFKTIDGPFRATIIICPPTKRKLDLENRIKACLDAAQLFGIIKDDANCKRHTAWFGDPEEAPSGARLIIEPIKPKLALTGANR